MALEIIRPASRAQWLEARRQDVTASVAGCLIDGHLPPEERHPYVTPYGLWAEKSGAVPSGDDGNAAMRRGRLLEPVAIEMLREDRPDWDITYARDDTYYRDAARRIGATPDAFATRNDAFGQGVVQVKTTHEDTFRRQWRDPETGEIRLPLWIAVQTIMEAHLTGAAWGCVAVMVMGRGIELHVIDVPLHPRVMDRIGQAVAGFWAMTDSGVRPEIDWLRDGKTVMSVFRESGPERRDLTGDETLDPMIAEFLAARAQERQAGAVIDAIRPKIIAALGNAEAGWTRAYDISAKSALRKAHEVKESWSRPLRIRSKD